MMPYNLCHPLLLLPSVFPSIRVFSNELALPIWRPKYGASASVLPMNIQGQFSLGLTGFISICPSNSQEFSLHHNLKASILQWSALFMVQLSYLCMAIGKTTALTIWTFVGKVMSLIFNMLSYFVIAFFPRSKLFFFLFNFLTAVTVHGDFGAPQNKICHSFFPFYLPLGDGTRCHDLSVLNVEF